MSHIIHITKAFVLYQYDRGEYDRLYALYTRDFGKIYAYATGIRRPHSKLRGHLNDYNCISVSLLRGREYWKILSTHTCFDTVGVLQSDFADSYIRILSTIRRMYRGETMDHHVFDDIFQGIVQGTIICQRADADPILIETLIIARFLARLGYIRLESLPYIQSSWQEVKPCLEQSDFILTPYIKAINQAFRESHL